MMPNPNSGWGHAWIPQNAQLLYGWNAANTIPYPPVMMPPPPTTHHPGASIVGAELLQQPLWNANQWPQWYIPANWVQAPLPQSQPRPPPLPVNTPVPPRAPPPPPPPKEQTLQPQAPEISAEEKQFDIQFIEWEKKFAFWREENKEHPDKKALAEYTAQWEGWRQQLLQKRELLRKQREDTARAIHVHQLAQAGLISAQQMATAVNHNGKLPLNHNSFQNSVPSPLPNDHHKHDPHGQNGKHNSNSYNAHLKAGQPSVTSTSVCSSGLGNTEVAPLQDSDGRISANQRNSPHQFDVGLHDACRNGIGKQMENDARQKLFPAQKFTPAADRLPVDSSDHDQSRKRLRHESVMPVVCDDVQTKGLNIEQMVTFDYCHLPAKYGQYWEPQDVVLFDYSHDSCLNKSHDLIKVQTRAEAKLLFPSAAVPPTTTAAVTVAAQQQLFPSAAAIDSYRSAAAAEVLNSPKREPVVATVEAIEVEDLLLPPGRHLRPAKVVVIVRGLPGCGKSHVARLLKETEVAMGGSPPRILSIDDYYLMDDTSPIWTSQQEEQYRHNLIKMFKRNLDDGHFSFIIVDSLSLTSAHVMDLLKPAQMRGFAVYLIDLPPTNRPGATRKCTDNDVQEMSRQWQEMPTSVARLNVNWLLRKESSNRDDSTSEDIVTSTTVASDDVLNDSVNNSASACPSVSKWEMMEQTGEKLDRLDGIVKRKLDIKLESLEDWLQLPDDYSDRKSTDDKKRVRWADIEERGQQEKMRAMGFVVGQTDWSRMTDPTCGGSALTKTKYI